ncbi:basic leucine zipper [Salix suchowensis]|nr:basic leucine zipper [Salix suchowensis]
MSKQSLLPPRCPFQKHVVSRPIHDSFPQHHRSPSQGSILEEKPAWLDDLLSDEDADSRGASLRRSASDSVTLLEGIVDSFSGLSPSSMYGPNSPRRRGGNVTFSENAIASALSEYAFQNPLQHADGSLFISGNTPWIQWGMHVVRQGSSIARRALQSGQRSRVRKLQYIAELERTVNVLQTLESELAFKVASLLQKRAALSLENNTLKQRVARLRQEKLIVDAQHKSLKKEAERLKNKLGSSTNNNIRTYSRSSLPPEDARSEVTWHMAKLNLN